jgi:hypothetical protein
VHVSHAPLIAAPVFGGIFTSDLSGAVTALVGFTGLFGGGARYAAILARLSEDEVERATGVGFFTGFGLGAIFLAIDALT